MAHRASLHLLLALPLSFAPALLGCDDGSSTDNQEDSGTESGEHMMADCSMEDRDDEFAIGLSKSGEATVVSFVAADPAPPAMGDNTWTVTVSDPGGEPLADASITAVTPKMPDHGHGTPVEAVATATANPGEFTITPVNLFMAGYWEVTLDIDAGGGTTDSVVFAFCVE